ncbi:MAG TPA: uroporphyrinogen decarboxylase family protein [Chloroflexota bacterium]|nr:uroporphyrinogen decarboxylase family protein [Chloroflexota bacterium]
MTRQIGVLDPAPDAGAAGTMTDRERVLAVMERRPVDRIPWIPRLLIWHTARRTTGTMPPELAGMTLREVERALGVGTPARDGRVFRVEYDGGVEVRVERAGNESVLEYRTPVGTVRQRRVLPGTLAAVGIGESEVDYFLKVPEDYDALDYLAEHTRYVPTYDAYLAYEREVGDDGYPMVSAGDCPFHHFLRQLAGYERGYLELADRPERVERLVRVMTDVDRERLWPVLEQSPARLLLHGVHLSSQMTPPPYFRRFIAPYYRELSARLHAADRWLVMHADNDTRLILPDLKAAGFDLLECFATAPLTRTTLAEARAVLGTDVAIWGGVPSVLLEPDSTPEDEFERYMQELFDVIAPGDAFILGVSDNVMPEADITRIARITRLVAERGRYPVAPRASTP